MVIDLPKAPSLNGATSAWSTNTDGEPFIACGNGHLAYIPDHEVAVDGSVTPSLLCPEEGCGWHVFARLEGWVTAGLTRRLSEPV